MPNSRRSTGGGAKAPRGSTTPLNSWSRSDWFTAVLGELGEAANVAKKLNRVRDGIPGNSETEAELRAALAVELADTFCYLDLLAQSEGVDLGEAVIEKFNYISRKIGSKLLISDGMPDVCVPSPAWYDQPAEFNQ